MKKTASRFFNILNTILHILLKYPTALLLSSHFTPRPLLSPVSPKYMGSQTPVTVKTRVVELLFMWTIDLKSKPKILEAYNMLKTQGVVKVSLRKHCIVESVKVRDFEL